MTQDFYNTMSTFLKLIYAQIQIEAELEDVEQFGSFCIKLNVQMKGDYQSDLEKKNNRNGTDKRFMTKPEIANFVVDKGDVVEVYLIRPFWEASRKFPVSAKELLEQILFQCRETFGKDGVEGSEKFLFFSSYIMDPRVVLIYWCVGDGIIYFQFIPRTEFLRKIKLIIYIINCLYIQYFERRKYT